jgi:hypothetical protein
MRFLTWVAVIIAAWYFWGATALAVFLPVIKQNFWYDVAAGSGVWDFIAGMIFGAIIAVIFFRPFRPYLYAPPRPRRRLYRRY